MVQQMFPALISVFQNYKYVGLNPYGLYKASFIPFCFAHVLIVFLSSPSSNILFS